jgi:hypothetical protein
MMDPLVHHMDPKVEPTGEPVDRPSHPDSQARSPAQAPPRLLRAPTVPFVFHPRSIATRLGPMPHTQRRARLRMWLSHFLRFCHALSHFCYNGSVIFRFRQPFLSYHPFSFSDSVIF